MSARILITGAAQGMGRAFAEYFAARGDRVLAVDIRDSAVEISGIRTMICDVTDPESLATAVAVAQREWGGLDGVVANAAIFDGVVRAPIEDLGLDEYARVMDVNVKGVWLTVRAALPALRAAGGGSIVTLASEVVNAGSVNLSHYVASKAAVVGLTRALARELGPAGIRINAISPGFTETEGGRNLVGGAGKYNATATPLGRVADVTDMCGAVEFLLGGSSGFVTGQTLLVNGGRVLA
ncbi:SDR family NAD(P)-dependent oxidoreductase [Nocardia jiangxiensis]|uniref:SDR family NAD(P)-dependent oxidoreductase n=1 Tax=Nocardia jiangxiensis TaxID=282685 RepID=A0ABW6SC34_9NOCA